MPYEQILFEVDDPVATITLNRPDSLNAWTDIMAEEVRDAVGRAATDPAVVGIVLTGAGRGFCAGADMKLLSGLSSGSGAAERLTTPRQESVDPTGSATSSDFAGTYTYLLAVPKPIIGAINGPVAGMGVPIVLGCDVRFMNTDTVLTTSFAQRGLVAEWGLSWLLTRLVGPANALDLLYTARKIRGDEAARIGLVNRALPADEVVPAAQEYVRQLARTSSPTSMSIMKRQVYEQLHAGLGAAERESVRLMGESFTRPDFAEGVASYLEKRDPDFPRLGT
ncbi:MAG: enoyl-CoA hydratase/isomerase family protein [Acidimicrobiia bacterium]|nr:enoyl-CoA hydratase/isomerase family protein [Acidimicrobiia bacterium]